MTEDRIARVNVCEPMRMKQCEWTLNNLGVNMKDVGMKKEE